MKLLASLVAAAAADYACCPYDEFGVVFSGCPLTEKTPWAIDSNNADPNGVEHHMCKAWEANIDATFEGNMNGDGSNDNWGGCGFQRHFPWNTGAAIHTGTVTQDTLQCKLGMFHCLDSNGNIQAADNHYRSLLTAADWGFSLETSGFGASGTNHVFGQVTLGGVCKLWIPVHRQHIDSVHVAGVHVRGGGEVITGEPTEQGHRASVFNGARVSESVIPATGTGGIGAIDKGATGTAYCFSVVNIAEFTENNMPGSAFNVMNGNVAGKDQGGMDMHLLQGRQDGHPNNPDYDNDGTNDDGQYPINFGDTLAFSNGDGTIVEGGGNFDVVVHFKSDWCIRHWTIVDMQAWDDATFADSNAGDWGSLKEDYEIEDQDPAKHAHTDAFDKRFDASTVGICGCGDPNNNDERYASMTAAAVSGTNLAAKGCSPAVGDGCEHTQNAYTKQVADLETETGLSYFWPNAGAWAAFFSFVTCSDDDFMIYEASAITAGTGDATVVEANTPGSDDVKLATRMVVHSMFYNDIRHDYSNANGAEQLTGNVNIRGNIRQVGRDVKYCAPGWMNWNSESDSRAGNPPPGGMSSNAVASDNFKRCTWNWNFNGNAGMTGSDSLSKSLNDRDPETWFNGHETTHGSSGVEGKGPFGSFRPWGNTGNPGTASAVGQGGEIDRFDDDKNGFGNLIYPVVQEIEFQLKFKHETPSTAVAPGTNNPHAPPQTTGVSHDLTVDAAKYVENTIVKNGIGIDDQGHSFSFKLGCLLSSLDGSGPRITNQDETQVKNDITNSNSNVHVKDMWPDCYMGDEIHFNYKMTMGDPGIETTEHRINAWDTEITTKSSLFWPSPNA